MSKFSHINRLVFTVLTVSGLLGIMAQSGCVRGGDKQKPPVHLVKDMDFQQKYETQEPGPFFADGLAMRQPVAGTLARGHLNEDSAYYTGKMADGSYVTVNPVELTPEGQNRGRERFNVYCSPCHHQTGNGLGVVVSRGYVPPPSFQSETVRAFSDGYIFEVISDGVRNMPSYGHQVPVPDRWLIVNHVRELQR